MELVSVLIKLTPTPANRRSLDKARTDLDLCLSDEADRTLRWARQKWYAKANKPTAQLANRLRTFTPKFTPITLRTRHNILTGNPQKVLEEFCHRLTKLYSPPNHSSMQGLNAFLKELSLPSLSESHISLMDRDIQVSEVLQCIKKGPKVITTLPTCKGNKHTTQNQVAFHFFSELVSS